MNKHKMLSNVNMHDGAAFRDRYADSLEQSLFQIPEVSLSEIQIYKVWTLGAVRQVRTSPLRMISRRWSVEYQYTCTTNTCI